MATRRNSGSSCGVVLLLIVLAIATILVYRAGLMPPPVAQFLDPIAKQLEPIGKQLEPMAKQLEPMAKQLEAFAKSFPGIAQSPTPAAKP